MTPRGNFGLWFVHIRQLTRIPGLTQLMTHPAIQTTPLTLQLCFKTLGVMQRVTKIQKVHMSSHDRLKIFITSTLQESVLPSLNTKFVK